MKKNMQKKPVEKENKPSFSPWHTFTPTMNRASGFTMAALTLVINQVNCLKCKTSHSYSQGVMLKLKGKQGEFIYIKPKVNAFDLDLPREKRNIPYHVEACENCFICNETPAQFSLFEKEKKKKEEFTLLGTKIGKKDLFILRPKSSLSPPTHVLPSSLNAPVKEKKKKKPEKKSSSVLELF